MLEYPEIKTIVSQMETELIGKTVEAGLMVKRNNNMFMNEDHAESNAPKIAALTTPLYLLNV